MSVFLLDFKVPSNVNVGTLAKASLRERSHFYISAVIHHGPVLCLCKFCLVLGHHDILGKSRDVVCFLPITKDNRLAMSLSRPMKLGYLCLDLSKASITVTSVAVLMN